MECGLIGLVENSEEILGLVENDDEILGLVLCSSEAS